MFSLFLRVFVRSCTRVRLGVRYCSHWTCEVYVGHANGAWHARGQRFKSPILHFEAEVLSRSKGFEILDGRRQTFGDRKGAARQCAGTGVSDPTHFQPAELNLVDARTRCYTSSPVNSSPARSQYPEPSARITGITRTPEKKFSVGEGAKFLYDPLQPPGNEKRESQQLVIVVPEVGDITKAQRAAATYQLGIDPRGCCGAMRPAACPPVR
jgi:hypothetical protein